MEICYSHKMSSSAHAKGITILTRNFTRAKATSNYTMKIHGVLRQSHSPIPIRGPLSKQALMSLMSFKEPLFFSLIGIMEFAFS
jgi:hypothetical protein